MAGNSRLEELVVAGPVASQWFSFPVGSMCGVQFYQFSAMPLGSLHSFMNLC